MIVVADTSICSSNTGDQIIARAAYAALRELTDRYGLRYVPTHTGMGYRGRRIVRQGSATLVAGTNLLSAHVGIKQQWRTPPLPTGLRRMITFGCAFGSGEDPVGRTARTYLRSVLDPAALHSVRDRHAADSLTAMGFQALYTGCPTMWLVDSIAKPTDEVDRGDGLVILNASLGKPELDRLLLETGAARWDRLHFWAQSPMDFAYRSQLPPGSTVVAPSLEGLGEFLLTHPGAEILTTRLHAAIFCQWHGARPRLIAVDTRTKRCADDAGMTRFAVPTSRTELDAVFDAPTPLPANPPAEAKQAWFDALTRLVESREHVAG